MKKYKDKRSKVVSVNQDTGEILEGVLVYCGVKHNPYATGWIMNSQEALEILASDSELSKEAYKVLIFLMSRLDFQNWINIFQKEIAEKLNIKKQNVSRAISLLESKEILLRGPKIGKSYSFRLNPYFGWKGKTINLDKYREEKEQERIEKLKNKIQKETDPTLTILSKKYNIHINKIEKFLAENTEVK